MMWAKKTHRTHQESASDAAGAEELGVGTEMVRHAKLRRGKNTRKCFCVVF